MRESEWYFGIAILFAVYLTWRLTRSVRKTMRVNQEPPSDDQEEQ